MKVRTGFVSNSSSVSFVIYGAYFEAEDGKIKEKGHACDLGVFYAQWDGMYVGEEWCNIKDDETSNEFKRRIKEKIRTVFGDSVAESCETHKEGYYDG